MELSKPKDISGEKMEGLANPGENWQQKIVEMETWLDGK